MTNALPIVRWNDLPKIKWNSLLLGNGASIALHSQFHYESLLQVARARNSLPTADGIFATLETIDFEHVLQVCWHASIVNSALGQPDQLIEKVHAEVRDALILAVQDVHGQPATLGSMLSLVGRFAACFDTVVTFNYDLTLYWATMLYNENHGGWFKDAFVKDGVFHPTWYRLREPYGTATGATLVFYAHGSLVLGLLSQCHRKVAGTPADDRREVL